MMLAWHFREPDVDRFLDSISSHQITEWMAYHSIEREDERQAALAAKAERNVMRRR